MSRASRAQTASRRPGTPASLRLALLVLALTLIVLGVLNGGLHSVLIKAVNICTECIGLG